MKEIEITKVAVMTDGRLAVYPTDTSPSHQYVYREAAGVNWNQDLGCFQSTVPREWNHRQWFTQIVSVVRTGLGIRLRLTPKTRYESDCDHFETDIIRANEDVEAWIKERESNQ